MLWENPNASLIALESLTLFAHDMTLDDHERERLFKAARMLAPSIKSLRSRIYWDSTLNPMLDTPTGA